MAVDDQPRVSAAMAADDPPSYRRVKEHVLGHILAGDWAIGARIPSEHELKDQFRVSRMTVHRALRELTDEGYVSRTVGAGTFVADWQVARGTIQIRDIIDEASEAGLRCLIRVAGVSRGAAGADTAARLGVKVGAPVFCTTLVRWIGASPMQLEERWVNAALVPNFLDHDFERMPPASVLARLAPVTEIAHQVRAVVPNGKRRTLLALQSGEACLLLSVTVRAGDTVLSVADFYHPGDRYALPGGFL